MSMISRLFRDSSSNTPLSDREKRLRRRRFLKGLEDHSRSMRMEHLEPRLLLAGDFFDTGALEIYRDGGFSGAIPSTEGGPFTEAGSFYVAKKGGAKIVKVDNAVLEFDGVDVLEFTTTGSGGTSVLGKGGGANWELLTTGSWTIKTDSLRTETVDAVSGDGDYLDFGIFEFDTANFGFANSALTVQGGYQLAGIPGLIAPFSFLGGGAPEFDIEGNNYWRLGHSGKLLTTDASFTIPDITFPLVPGLSGMDDPQVSLEEPQISYVGSEDVFRLAGKVGIENLWNGITIQGDFLGDDEAPKYVQLSQTGTGGLRVDTVGTIELEPFEIGTGDKAITIAGNLEINTIDEEYTGSLTLESEAIGDFSGIATFSGGKVESVAASYAKQWALGNTGVFFQQAFLGLDDIDDSMDLFVGAEATLGPEMTVEIPAIIAGTDDPLEADFSPATMSLVGSASLADFCSVSTSMTPPSTFEDWFEGKPQTTGFNLLTAEIDDEEWSLVTGTLDANFDWCEGVIDGDATVNIGDGLAAGTLEAKISFDPQLSVELKGNATIELSRFDSWLPDLNGNVVVQYNDNSNDHIAAYSEWWGGDYGFIYWLESGEFKPIINGSYAGSFMEGEHDPSELNEHGHWEYDTKNWDELLFAVTWENITPVADIEARLQLVDDNGVAYSIDPDDPNTDFAITRMNPDVEPVGTEEFHAFKIESIDPLFDINQDWTLRYVPSGGPIVRNNFNFTSAGLYSNVNAAFSQLAVGPVGAGDYEVDYEVVVPDPTFRIDFYGEDQDTGNRVLINSVENIDNGSFVIDDSLIPSGSYNLVAWLQDTPNSPVLWVPLPQTAGSSFVVDNHNPFFDLEASEDLYSPNPNDELNVILEGKKYFQFTVVARDIDGDPLTYSLVNPPSMVGIDSNTGLVTVVRDYTRLGPYTEEFTISVSDDSGGTSEIDVKADIVPDGLHPADFIQALNLVGHKIQDVASQVTVPSGIPFISNAYSQTVSFADTFLQTTTALFEDPQLLLIRSADVIPYDYSVNGQEAAFYVQLDSKTAYKLELDANVTDAAGLITELRQALDNAGAVEFPGVPGPRILEPVLQVIDGEEWVVIKPVKKGVYDQLLLSNFYVESNLLETVAPNGILQNDLSLQVSLEHGDPGLPPDPTNIDQVDFTISLAASETAENESFDDLLEQLQAKLPVLGIGTNQSNPLRFELFEDQSGDHRIVLLGTSKSTVVELDLVNTTAGPFYLFDDTVASITESDFNNPHGFEPQLAHYQFTFNTVQELVDQINDFFADDPAIPDDFHLNCPGAGSECLTLTHDQNSNELLFEFHLEETWSTSVPLDFTEPLDVGNLGTVEIVGAGAVDVQLTAELDTAIGIDMTPGGRLMPLGYDTLLSELYNYDGLRIDVSLEANQTPPDFNPTTFDLPLKLFGSFTNPTSPAIYTVPISTNGNTSIEMLAEDVDSSIKEFFANTIYEGKIRAAASQAGKIVLTNTDAVINKLELDQTVSELGFTDVNQLISKRVDLKVVVQDDILHATQAIADSQLPTVLSEDPVYGTNPYKISLEWNDPASPASGVLAPTLYDVTYDQATEDYSLKILNPVAGLDYSIEYDYLNPVSPTPSKTFEVILDDTLTVGDVIAAINDTTDNAGSLAEDGTPLTLSDLLSVNLNAYRGLEIESEYNFQIVEPDLLFSDLEPILGESAAAGNGTLSTIDALGLTGTVSQSVPTLDQVDPEYIEIRGGYRLDGSSLDKRPLHHRVWVREDSEAEPTVSLHAELEIDDANITASWGIVEAVGELCLYADAESKVWWTDPAYRQADSKLYLDELTNSPVKDWFDADWLSFNVSDCNHNPGIDNIGTDGGSAELDLDLAVLGQSLVNVNATASTDPGKSIGEPDWFSWNVLVTKSGGVNGFSQGLTVDAVIQAVHQGVEFLQDKATGNDPDWDWLNKDLPLANRSVADGLDFLDDVLDKIDQWVYQVDTAQLSTVIAELKSLVHNLPDTVTDELGSTFQVKERVKDKIDRAIDFLENALNVEPERLLSRLIVSSSFLQSLVGQRVSPSDSSAFDFGELVPELVDKPNPLDGKNYKWGFDTTGDGVNDLFFEMDEFSPVGLMFKDLQEKALEIKESIPSMANLIENLGPRLENELCEAVYDAQQCDVDNPFGIDLKLGDVDSDSIDDTILLGLRYDPQGPLAFERFTPHFDVADYGPIEIDVDGDVALTVDGFVQLSMGVTSADTGLEFFLITDGNAPIAPTAAQFNASVLGEVSASVGFGALSALSGEIGLSIAEAAVEEHVVNAGQITLNSAPEPSDNGSYLFIYEASGTNLISPDQYEVNGATVSFNGTGYSTVTAVYNTQTIEPPTLIAGGLAVGSKSQAFTPQGGTAAKVHLVNTSTMEVIDENDYELVDDSGIKVKAIADLSGSDLYLSYMPEIVVQTNTLNLPPGQQTISFPQGPLSPLFGSNRNLRGINQNEVITVTETVSGDPVDFEMTAAVDPTYPSGYRYELAIGNADYDPTLSYEISYPTRQTFFDGAGPASIYFDLNNPKYLNDPASTPNLNPFGGVKISELSEYQPNLLSSVFATASVDAEILGSSQADVAFAAGMMVGDSPEIDETQFEFRAGIDADALNDMLSNIDFNLKTIIQGLEAFLELLETGLKEKTLAKLPLIDANDLDNAAEFVRELRTGFVEPIRERLCKAGGQPLSVLEGELAAWIFSALGPGLESASNEADGFQSLFKDLALGNGEPDWLIKAGLGLIKMEDFRFSNTVLANASQIEAKAPFNSGGDIQSFIRDQVRAGDTYVYKRLGNDWLQVTIPQNDDYALFKAIVPVTFGEEGDKFEIGDIGFLDGAELVGGGTARIGNVPLGKLYEFDVNFDHGLKGLPFEVEGDPRLEIDFDLGFDLGIGVDKNSGFYFITNDESGAHQGKELDVALDIGFPDDFAMGIDLFGLTLQAADNGTGLTTDFTVDITDFNTDNHLTFNEISSHSFGDWFVPELAAEANLDITLSAEINSNIPSIAADLRAGLAFSLVVENGEIETEFSTTAIGFYDVQLDLGDFLTKTIGPILKKVDSVLDPVKPIVDFLTMEIPGISDASKMAGNGSVLVMDLAFAKDPEMGEKARQFVGIVQQIMDVVEMLASFEEGESMAISFGDFGFGQAGTSGEDINLLEEPFPSNLGSTLDDVYNETGGASAEDVTEQANNGSNTKVSAGFAKIDEDPGPLGLAGLGIQLDIIKDPMNIVKLLTGQTANLVSWDIPRFDLIFEYSQDFPIIPVPPISLGIGADFGLFADFSVGMDTRFKQTGNFLDGFYFGDLEGVHTGPDIAELGITIGAQLRAALDLLIVKAGVEGELRANIDANWADTNDDGKMYLDEMAQIIRQDGFECLFDISGELRALVNLFYEVDLWLWSTSGEVNIVDVLLYEFELQHCPKSRLAHVSENGEVEFETPGGEVLTSGTDWLIIHAGEFGDMRGGSSSDTHEYYEIRYAGGVEPELTIEFNYGDLTESVTSDLTDIDTIYFSGGYGADTLKLSGDWPSDVSVLFDGGDSSDTLLLEQGDYTIAAGTPDLIALGGSGNDDLLVSAGTVAWELWGEAGNDTIEGSSASDAIFGGADGDVIKAGSGSDFVDAGSGNDRVYAFDPAFNNAEADYVLGGSGDDYIWTGQGDDQVDAGTGNDVVYAGAGNDVIDGSAGNDNLYGEAGADTILGGSGNDNLSGWVSVDALLETRPELASDYSDLAALSLISDADGILSAPSSPPLFLGMDLADQIAGQDGDDVILGYDGADLLAGGAGNDFIVGHEGGDDEQLYGGFGDDVLIAHLLGSVDSTDNHQLYGGPDDDYFCGTHGDDRVYGGTLIDATTTLNNGGVVSLKPILSGTNFSGLAASYASKSWAGNYPPQDYEILPADLENPPASNGAALTRPVCHVVVLDGSVVTPEVLEAPDPSTTKSLTGFVYLDANEDAQRGEDEEGIPEIIVQLQDREGEIVLETMSGEDGSYGFDNVDQGDYKIVQILDASGVYLQLSPPNEHSDQNVYDVVVSADEQEFGSFEFGNKLEGKVIQGRKLSLNSTHTEVIEKVLFGDPLPELSVMYSEELVSDQAAFTHTFGASIAGINGWEIYLYDTDWNLLDSTFTSTVDRNEDGQITPSEIGWYEFDHLPSGQYIVSEQYRPGWAQVLPPLYFDNAITPVKDDGYSWTNSYAQVSQLSAVPDKIDLELNLNHDNVGELHMWLEAPGDGVNPGPRVPLTWQSQRDVQDRRTAEYRGYGFGVEQGDLLDATGGGKSTTFTTDSNATDIELVAISGVSEVSDSTLHDSYTNPEFGSLLNLGSTSAYEGQWRLIIEDVEEGNSGELLDWTLHFYGQEDEKKSYPGGVNRHSIQSAGVRTSYVVDMSVDEPAIVSGTAGEKVAVTPDLPGGPYYHFGNYQLVGDISGTKWNDIDGDGKRGANEPGISGVKIYLDQNDNGEWDYADSNANGQWDANPLESHEPFVYTDAEGNYTFVNIPTGEHTVREEAPEHWQTSPLLLYSENFESELNSEFNAVWSSDTSATSLLQPHVAPSGVTSFLGDFTNDRIELDLYNLPAHQDLRVSFDLYVLGSWDGDHAFQGEDRFRFSANGNPYLVDTSFSNHDARVVSWQNANNPLDVEVQETPGNVTTKDSELLFNFVAQNGAVDLSVVESDVVSSQGYLDVTGDGHISPADVIRVFNQLSQGEAEGRIVAGGDLKSPQRTFEQSYGLNAVGTPVMQSGEERYAPRTGAQRTMDFGNLSTDYPLPLEFAHGTAAHNTLGYDMYGRSAQQSEDFLPADTTYHFEIDLNHDSSHLNLIFEGLGLTNDGKTNFERWGIDNIRVLKNHHVVTVEAGQIARGIDFGNQDLPDNVVTGTKYRRYDGQDYPGSGVFVYADINANGQWDASEPNDITGKHGQYRLEGIRTNMVTIREIPNEGWGPLEPGNGEIDVEFKDGNEQNNINFYNGPFTTISGMKWNDQDANGKQNGQEGLLEGITIGLDLNNDGTIDRTTMTSSEGVYEFTGVAPGKHRVVEFVPLGWSAVYPDSGEHIIVTQIGVDYSGVNFGNQREPVVSGTKFIQSTRGGEIVSQPAAGFTIYADFNNNLQWDAGEPSAETLPDNPVTANVNELGTYQLSGFGGRDSVVIRELEASGWQSVAPEGGRHIVDLTNGLDFESVNFTNRATGIVSGYKWNDLDGDGIWSAKEPAIEKWQIGLDLNGDETPDMVAITNAYGYYEAVVPAGIVAVAEFQENGWQQTYPPSKSYQVTVKPGMHVQDLNFGNVNPEQQAEGDGKVKVFAGVLFHDVNNDGKLEPNVDAPLNNWTVYADLNKNDLLDNADLQVKSDDSGNFRIELDTGQMSELGIRVAAQQGWIVSSPTNGEYLLDVSENDLFSELNFLSVEGATVSGHKWGDENLDARWDGDEKGLSGWEIRIDLGSDGDGGYDLSTVTNESGYYEFSNLPSGTHRIFEVHQEGWHQTAPETVSHTVSVTPGKTYSDRNFGNFQQVVITGKKTDKSTGNGVAGVTIYADLNSDGDRDPGEPMAVTANDVPATTSIDETGDYKLYVMRHDSLKIREIVPAGWTLSEPSTGHHDLNTSTVSRIENVNFVNVQDAGSISGSKWNDLDGDGVWDENEPGLSDWTIQLDAGQDDTIDQTVVTDSQGNFMFTGLSAGRYRISEVIQNGWSQTFPKTGFYSVTLDDSGQVENIDFGNRTESQPGSISGSKWNDQDGDGIWDVSEPGLPAWTIQLDIGRDGKVDRTTTTDSQGNYIFSDLAAGAYQVLEVQQPGWEQTFPQELAHSVNLVTGQDVIDVDFGNHQDCEVHGRKTGIHGDVGIPGVQIYADLNGNSQYDPGEPATLTSFDDPATDKDETGYYSMLGLPCDPVTIRETLPSGWAVYAPDNGKFDVSFDNQSIVTNLNFKNQKLGMIYGYKRYDSDEKTNGLYGTDGSLDKGLDGWLIQVDYHWEGIHSTFVEDASVQTQSDNPDTPQNEEGLYVFENVPPGTHLVKEVLQPGWTQTYPESDPKRSGRNYLVHIDGAEVKGSYDFGNQSQLTVHGRKLDYENPEQGLAGFVIYADSNNNGILDEGEVSTTTASDGSYTLTGIDQNQVHIREVQKEGYLQKYPDLPNDSHLLTFMKQTTISDVNFQNQAVLLVPDGNDEIHIFGGNDHIFGDNEIDKSDPAFEKFISTGKRNDTYVFEQVLAKNGTASASVGNETDSLHDYEKEGLDTFTFETLYNYYGYGDGTLAGINNPSVALDLGSVNPALPFNIHAIAGGNERIIHFENNDENYIERIVGSTEDDHLIGNERQQILVGHLGSDTLEAKGRDDVYKFFNNFEVLDTVSGITGITGVTLQPSVVGPETDVIVEATLGGHDKLDLAALESWSDIVVDLSTAGGQHELIDGGHLRSFDFQGDQSLEVFITGIVTNASVTGNDESQTFIGGGAGTTIFNGGAGADFFVINPEAQGGSIQVDGGAENDTIDLSQLHSDFVHEMNGVSSSSESPDGTVMTFGDVEVLSGSQGDDYVKFLDNFGLAPDFGVIHGNAGLNTLDYDEFPTRVDVDLSVGAASGTAEATQFDDVIGSKFDDELIGSEDANRIVGNAGSDDLIGRGGADHYEFGDDGSGLEVDNLVDNDFYPNSRNVIDLSAASTNIDVTVSGVSATILQNGRRQISVYDITNIGELRTGSGEDSIELWDTISSGFSFPTLFPLVPLANQLDDGLRVFGGAGDDTYIIPGSFSTEVGIVEAFDVWDSTPNPPTLIAGGMDTLDFRAKVDSTKVSLNELTAVDSISGYAVRLYNPLIDQMTAAVLGGDDVAGFSLFENVLTGSGDDIIFGNDNDNLIDSGNGSDVVYGLAGADEIVVHGANGETNLVAGGAGHDLYRLQGDFSSGPDNRIFEAGASMTPGTGKLTPGGNDTIELEALGINCVYVNLQEDTAEEVMDCNNDPISITAGTVGVASLGVPYQEVLSFHRELMPIVDFKTIHSIHDVQTEISTSGDIYDSNGRFVENVLGTSTGQNWIWANEADNILTGGQQADTFTAIRGGDHFIYGAEGNDSMLLGPTGFASHMNTSGKGILFEADGMIPVADLDGVIVLVGDFDSHEYHAYEFDNDTSISWPGIRAITIGSYPTVNEIEQVELGEATFADEQKLSYAINQLQDAIYIDFSRYDADPTTLEEAINVVGTGLGLPGEGVGVTVINGVANSVRTYDLDHLYEHQAGERVIGNNVLIGGDGMDSIISHDGSDLILADEADLSFLGLYSTGEKLEFINELNNIWRADDDSAETRLDEMLALLNTESGYAHSSLNDYLTDDGDVDTVRLDSDYEIDLPDDEWSKGVDVFFGTVSQDLIEDSAEMSPEEDDLINGLP